MPLFYGDTFGPPGIAVHGSVAVELEWALASAWRLEFQRDHPSLARLYSGSPSLAERVMEFWPKDAVTSCGGSIELIALAHHVGLLACTEPAQLLANLDKACSDAPLDLPLRSETKADQAALRNRLARLRGSAKLRSSYVRLVTDVWSGLVADWEGYGRAEVEEAVTRARQRMSRSQAWREVAGPGLCTNHDDLVNELVGQLGPQGSISIVPAYFAHLGMVADLPGTMVIGIRAPDLRSGARGQTEGLARNLKALSDATRLAMVRSLHSSPMTVTELAKAFSLAQPTVSNHVRVLRDAGIVRHRPEGGQRKLELDTEALRDILGRLGQVFGPAAAEPLH
jgi:DNA-binding transcriptional ArsR family regulator